MRLRSRPCSTHRSPTHELYAVILALQTPSGTFAGDRFGETDTRFIFCAIAALSLMGQLGRLEQDGKKEKVIEHIRSCRNFDGGFGNNPGSESHSAQGDGAYLVNESYIN